MVLLVEAANFIILVTNYSVMDVIMNFLALVILSEFDDMFAKTASNDPIYKSIEENDDKI